MQGLKYLLYYNFQCSLYTVINSLNHLKKTLSIKFLPSNKLQYSTDKKYDAFNVKQ